MEKVELPFATLYYKAPIVHISFQNDVELGVPEIHKLNRQAEKLSRGKNYVVLSDIRGVADITHEGRRTAGDANECPYQKGTAVLAPNVLYQLAANVFANFDPPQFPYRAFTNKQKAIEWLLGLPLS